MNLYVRLLRVFFQAFFKSRLRPLDVSVLRFQVWPNDLDLNGHMNNGRYMTVMDLGRFDLLARMGIFSHFIRNRWQPLVGGAVLQFRRSLRPFQSYRLKTRIVCWDHKWFYLEQIFERGGKTVARGLVKALIRGKSGNLPTHEVIGQVRDPAGANVVSPEIPLWVAHWKDMDEAL